ncbi:MAG TPA: COX15/CtaA family protein [Thermoplasmata archaeon]|nr:COX15/CtaA family protein [Thermoplasmata archaeon]
MGRGHDLFRIVAVLACVLCYSTILLGGNVMASGDGLACPHWPTCFDNGNLLPAFQGGAAVEWSHRVSAFFLSVTVLVLAALALAYERTRRILMKLSLVSLGLVVTEALLGGLVVESGLLATLILVHLAIATALFGLLLILALLANLREMPRRWIEWARRATTETPAPRPATEPWPSAPAPSDRPSGVGRPREG